MIGGDPWREMGMEGGGESSRRTDQLIEERKRASGAERHILVTLSSQGDVVPAAVLEAVRSSPSTWRYWFRLHPVNQAARGREAKRILRPLGVDLGLLEFATEVPLHALLRQMDGHLSVNLSTVVTEAAGLGVASIACGPEAPEFYPAEIAAGMLLVATTPSEVLAALHRVLGAGRRLVTAERPRAPAAMLRLLAGDLTAETIAHSSTS